MTDNQGNNGTIRAQERANQHPINADLTVSESPRGSHTPGPWRPTGRNYIGQFIVGAAAARLGFIAAVDDEANARLIAAAPEMLDVLKLIVAFADDQAPSEVDYLIEAVSRARRVIAKATGH